MLRRDGQGDEARMALKEQVAARGTAFLHRAQHTLPAILSRDEGDLPLEENQSQGEQVTIGDWVEMMITGWSEQIHARGEGDRECDEEQLVQGTNDSLPFGIFHAAHVWPDGTWSTAEEMENIRRAQRLSMEENDEGVGNASSSSSSNPRSASRTPRRRQGNIEEDEENSQLLVWMLGTKGRCVGVEDIDPPSPYEGDGDDMVSFMDTGERRGRREHEGEGPSRVRRDTEWEDRGGDEEDPYAGVHPRWLTRNRTRTPETPRPKRKARPAPSQLPTV